MNQETIEFRLSYWQTLVNPTDGCLCVVVGLFTGVLGGFLIWTSTRIIGPLSFLGCFFCGLALLFLLYRSPKRRMLRYISFTIKGVAFDCIDCVLGTTPSTDGPHTHSIIPYRYLTVWRGPGSVSTLKSLSGHFVLIPTKAISRDRLKQLIEEGKRKEHNHSRQTLDQGNPT